MDVPRESGLLSASNTSNGLSENERSSDLRDPWGEEPGGADGETSDPAEVTVQLDSLNKGRPDGSDAASDVPVFVDESGRRSRTFRRIGIVVGTACGAYAVVIVAALLSARTWEIPQQAPPVQQAPTPTPTPAPAPAPAPA
ncbi:hypothetical protein AB0L81_19430, partial [Streptomyces sp. NPDC052127]